MNPKHPDRPFNLVSLAHTDEDLIASLLHRLGYNFSNQPDLCKTPTRYVKALRELLDTAWRVKGPTDTLCAGSELRELMSAQFDSSCDEMVVVRNISFTSVCEHHLLPFSGVVHIGYVPKGKVLGLSKFARLVDYLSKQLQIQERLTDQIAEVLKNYLAPSGVGVMVEAEHLCMTLRGARKVGASMQTSSLRGVMLTKPEARDEFFRLVGRGKT